MFRYESPIAKVLKHPLRFMAVMRVVLSWLKMYFRVQSINVDSEATIIEVAVDERIQPEESAIYPYLFAVVYIMFTAWYLFERITGPRYADTKKAFAAMLKDAERIFLAVPTRMRNRERSTHPLTLYTQEVDGPTNCYPSLHVALVFLSYQILKDVLEDGGTLLAAMRRSCTQICRSTLLTKQHSVVDVIGGIHLARIVYAEHFEDDFEELLPEIIPELAPDELAAIAAVTEGATDLVELLPELLGCVSAF